MKKIKVLFAIIFILLFASCGKPREVNITDTEIREGIAYVKGETKAFTGIIKSYYDNGALKEDIPYKDGKENGIGKVYYPNGNLKGEVNHKDGKEEGLSKLYYENGNLESEINFKAGKGEGLSKTYYENGNLKGEGNFKDGKLEGLTKSYYENGNLESEMIYKDGKKDGISEFYYENGKLQSKMIYKDGTLLASFNYPEKYDKETTVIIKIFTEYGYSETPFNSDNQINGIYKRYDERGNLITKVRYKNGKRVY